MKAIINPNTGGPGWLSIIVLCFTPGIGWLVLIPWVLLARPKNAAASQPSREVIVARAEAGRKARLQGEAYEREIAERNTGDYEYKPGLGLRDLLRGKP